MLEADEAYFVAHGEPLFSYAPLPCSCLCRQRSDARVMNRSHMLDLSEESKEDNIATCVKYFKRMAKVDLWLEMEIGITGGEEDGVDNTGTRFLSVSPG